VCSAHSLHAFYHIALRGFEAKLIPDARGIRGIVRF
jgi:hypothetical protein